MIVKCKFSPGQKVSIADTAVFGRIKQIIIGQDYIRYLVRYWDGATGHNWEFEEFELEIAEKAENPLILVTKG